MAVYRCTFSGLLWGNVWNNVCHFGGDDPVDPVALANNLNVGWVERVKTFQHNQLTWLDIGVRDVTTQPGPAAYHLPINKIGTSSLATATDTNLVTVVLQFKTGTAGRHGRGRISIAGVPSGRFNIGLVEPSVLTIWQATANELAAHYGVNGSEPYKLLVAPRNNPSQNHAVVNIIVRQTQGTMRSRGYGRGV